jgi:hypothetical protein
LGWQPRAKVSMMNMRPPQQGHGRGSMRAWSAAGVSVVSGGSGLTGTAISSRAAAIGSIRSALSKGDAGIHKIAARFCVGTGTVQRIKGEMVV